MAQVDQIALVAARKVVGSQILFGLQQTAAHRPGIRGRVVVQKTVPRFQIKDVVGIQQLHPAADLQGPLPAAAALDTLQGALQLGAELVVADGLEHKVERVDLIPADGILCHVGDEHKHHIRVLPADALRRRHTAELWHLNIQKDDVKPGAVRLTSCAPSEKAVTSSWCPLSCAYCAMNPQSCARMASLSSTTAIFAICCASFPA